MTKPEDPQSTHMVRGTISHKLFSDIHMYAVMHDRVRMCVCVCVYWLTVRKTLSSAIASHERLMLPDGKVSLPLETLCPRLRLQSFCLLK